MISEKNAEFPLTVGPDVLDLSKDVWGFFSAGFRPRRA